jgi:hypothetical protein
MKYYGIKHKTYGLLGICDTPEMRLSFSASTPWLTTCKITAKNIIDCQWSWDKKSHLEHPQHCYTSEELELVEVELMVSQIVQEVG